MSVSKTSICLLLLVVFLPSLLSAQSSIYQDAKEMAKLIEANPTVELSFIKRTHFAFYDSDSQFGTIELIKDGEIIDLPVNKENKVDYRISSFGTYQWTNTIGSPYETNTVISDTITISLKDTSFVLGGNTLTRVRIEFSPDSLVIKSRHRIKPITMESLMKSFSEPEDFGRRDVEHYAVALAYRNVADIMRAHTDFGSILSNPSKRYETTMSKYQSNPFFKRLGNKRKISLPDYQPYMALLPTPKRVSFSNFYQQNYEWHHLLYGDSTLQLQREVSYQDVVSSYREPVTSAQNELVDANRKINAGTKKKNMLDAKSVAVGLSDFIAERAQEELNLTFFNRFKENLKDSSELTVLFPNTRKLLYQFEISDYKTLLSHARESFTVDLDNLGLNFPTVLTLPKYKDVLDNSPDVYNLSLVFSIATLAYRDIPVENIMISTFQKLENRKNELSIDIDKILADTLIYTPAFDELSLMVTDYIDGVERHKQGILECVEILDKEFREPEFEYVEYADLTNFNNLKDRYAIRLKPIMKFNKENRFIDYFGERKIVFHDSEFTEPNYLDFYKKTTLSNLHGNEYYGYLLEGSNKTPEEYAQYFDKNEHQEKAIIARGITGSRQLLEEQFLELLEVKQEELAADLLEVQGIKTNLETLSGDDSGQLADIEKLVNKALLLKAAISREILFWENKVNLAPTSHQMTALYYLKSMLENDKNIRPFISIQDSLNLGQSLEMVKKVTAFQDILKGKGSEWGDTNSEPTYATVLKEAKNALEIIAVNFETKTAQLESEYRNTLMEDKLLQRKNENDDLVLHYFEELYDKKRKIINAVKEDSLIIAYRRERDELATVAGSWDQYQQIEKLLLLRFRPLSNIARIELENVNQEFDFLINSDYDKKPHLELALDAHKEMLHKRNAFFEEKLREKDQDIVALAKQIEIVEIRWYDGESIDPAADSILIVELEAQIKLRENNFRIEINNETARWKEELKLAINNKINGDSINRTEPLETNTAVVASMASSESTNNNTFSNEGIPNFTGHTENPLRGVHSVFYQHYRFLERESEKNIYVFPEYQGLVCLADSLAKEKERFAILVKKRQAIKDHISDLEKTYCPNLVRARDNASNFAKGIELATHLLFAFRYNNPDTLVYYDTSQMKITTKLIDTFDQSVVTTATLDTVRINRKIIKESANDKNSTRWITWKEFEELKSNEVEWNLFLGMLYQRLRSIDDAPDFTSEGIALLATKFLGIVQGMEDNRTALRIKKATNPNAVNFKDYYPFIRSTVDLFNTVLTTNAIKGVNPKKRVIEKGKQFAKRKWKGKTKETDSKKTIKKPREEEEDYIVQSFATRDSTLNSIPSISDQALSLYENIYAHKHSNAIVNSMELLRTITSQKLNTKERRKAERAINAVLFYGTFMSGMIKAETSDQVKSILKSATVPPGSSRIKRETTSSFTINSYLGGAIARDVLLDAPAGIDKSSYGAAMSVPIGFTYSVSPNWIKNNSSVSLFVPLIDLGAITAYRQNPKNDDYSIESLPEIKWSNLFSPGVFAVYNFANNPFSVGVGGQYGPQLRKIELGDMTDPVFVNSLRFPMVFFNIDVPFFNLYTGSRKIIVK